MARVGREPRGGRQDQVCNEPELPAAGDAGADGNAGEVMQMFGGGQGASLLAAVVAAKGGNCGAGRNRDVWRGTAGKERNKGNETYELRGRLLHVAPARAQEQ